LTVALGPRRIVFSAAAAEHPVPIAFAEIGRADAAADLRPRFDVERAADGRAGLDRDAGPGEHRERQRCLIVFLEHARQQTSDSVVFTQRPPRLGHRALVALDAHGGGKDGMIRQLDIPLEQLLPLARLRRFDRFGALPQREQLRKDKVFAYQGFGRAALARTRHEQMQAERIEELVARALIE
jgi:hypothetical protein